MVLTFEQTSIWTRTLGVQEVDVHAKAREKLRTAYLSMRENVSKLVTLIPQDCPGLTVHDVSHLDALWEMADLIAGENFEINPAEAFIFGAAVLLHDSAMSIAAYPGGMKQIQETTEWTDAAYSAFRRIGQIKPDPKLILNPPAEVRNEIVFNALRALHAKQAENLISSKWQVPSSGDDKILLEDEQLRLSYGPRIGRIAHSHHWNIERLPRELSNNIGAATDLPSEWTLNEIKIACLLRCADAAHIDARRAPSMLYALIKPEKESSCHWNFQNKLGTKPTYQDGGLLYSSSHPFTVTDAPAWWLCFDTIKMIDKELSSSNAILQDTGTSQFQAKRVLGAENTAMLSRHVLVEGWKPVNAEIRVSNPAQLAQTLGGRNLYGRGAFAPIRELLQNAVDAVRARRHLEERDSLWGKIRLILENPPNKPGETWLHIDDTGVGMSERVLIGPLLDFGRSLWTSPLLQEELPGLESGPFKAIGKFGIGFFSIFLLGNCVRIISKLYSEGIAQTRVLEFSSLGNRPMLMDATPKELPVDFNTRISVKIEDILGLSELDFEQVSHRLRFSKNGFNNKRTLHQLLNEQIRQLIGALDVEIEIDDKIEGQKYIHNPNWQKSSPSEFLNDLVLTDNNENKKHVIAVHSHMISDVKGASGEYYGRAALWMVDNSDRRDLYCQNLISVGGFVYHGRADFRYVGVLAGDTENVARNNASSLVPKNVIASWASEQARLIDVNRFQIFDVIKACHNILMLEGNSDELPFCFSGGQFISLGKFRILLEASQNFYLPISKQYGDNFDLTGLEDIGASYFVQAPYSEVIISSVSKISGLFTDEMGKDIVANVSGDITNEIIGKLEESTSTHLLLKEVRNIWGEIFQIKVEMVQIFQGDFYNAPKKRWVLSLTRQKCEI